MDTLSHHASAARLAAPLSTRVSVRIFPRGIAGVFVRFLTRNLVPGLLGLTLLAGCVTTETAQPIPVPARQPAPLQVAVAAYPRYGQSSYQQRRDRYECYNWAVAQSGFDPGRLNLNEVATASVPVHVEPNPPVGTDTVALGITGALIGAAVSNPYNSGGGALAGLVLGGLLGAASDSARQASAQRIEDTANAHVLAQQDHLNERADAYRRATAACLEGRGYTVR